MRALCMPCAYLVRMFCVPCALPCEASVPAQGLHTLCAPLPGTRGADLVSKGWGAGTRSCTRYANNDRLPLSYRILEVYIEFGWGLERLSVSYVQLLQLRVERLQVIPDQILDQALMDVWRILYIRRLPGHSSRLLPQFYPYSGLHGQVLERKTYLKPNRETNYKT